MEQYFKANQKLWDDKVPFHLKSSLYNMEAFLNGHSSLCPVVQQEVGNVNGKSILHLQCHFGQDSLSLARMGAKVTGVDFSGEAISKARALNEQLGLDATFIQANVMELNEKLTESYDMVFTSFGTIIWLPELKAWANVISQRLKPGGSFVFVEFHPVINAMDWDRGTFDYNYFNSGKPYHEIVEGTYADKDADLKGEEYFWLHSFEDVLSPLLAEGMHLTSFKEYPFSSYDVFGEMKKLEEWKFVWTKTQASFPHMFSLQMTKK